MTPDRNDFDDATRRALTAPYGSEVLTDGGPGILRLVWFGVCDVADVELRDGTLIHVYPELGEMLALGADTPATQEAEK